ncbi:MAG: glycosyltransferase [Actinomycetota bacterium]|nr:glycosyltransferase [Actinomycetota bacterium]
MRVHIVDPSAYTPPYDHALAAALARAGAEVELVTSAFAYGAVPAAEGYAVRERFYRHARGAPGSPARRAAKLIEHAPDMVRYRRAARQADVVHFQWLAVQWLDPWLLPRRPLVLTAHDLLPREPRPGQARAQRRCYEAVDALVVHSEYGRRQLIEATGLDPGKVRVIHHGAFEHLTRLPREQPLSDELAGVEGPVVLFFGLLRPYKGVEILLDAWRGVNDAELWIVGRPRMAIEPLRERAPTGVRFVPRFVADVEIPAFFRRADLVVLPYSRTERFDFSGVLAAALAFGKPVVLTDVGGFSEVADTGAAVLVPPDDPGALREALMGLIEDPAACERLAAAATVAAAGAYSWEEAARRTLELYRELTGSPRAVCGCPRRHRDPRQ